MATRNYALDRGGPKRVALRWRSGWRDFEVACDGASSKLEPAALAAGATVALPDGSSLFVRRIRRPFWSFLRPYALHVERDGVPVPRSDGDPRVIGARAGNVLVAYAVLRLTFVILWVVFQAVTGDGFGGGFIPFAAYTLMLVAFGLLPRRGMRLPLLLGAGVLVLELLGLAWSAGRATPLAALVIQGLVIARLVVGWRGMRPRQRQPSLASVFE